MMLSIVIQVLYIVFQIYTVIMGFSILSSWIPSIRENRFLGSICEVGDAYLNIFRGKLILGIFDIGTIIGLIIYQNIISLILIL